MSHLQRHCGLWRHAQAATATNGGSLWLWCCLAQPGALASPQLPGRTHPGLAQLVTAPWGFFILPMSARSVQHSLQHMYICVPLLSCSVSMPAGSLYSAYGCLLTWSTLGLTEWLSRGTQGVRGTNAVQMSGAERQLITLCKLGRIPSLSHSIPPPISLSKSPALSASWH